ncbi:hypothetical protein [Methylosinus sp. Sm6]|uniref:hypothetical protein n=1 Tax=Methylosinus sp. Sm6 TaxID=2866948 RepID=UPI001C998328|nr:hypothetical protein [Methylosinus sp. Sm6]MBY6240996.1 hypothetical protein [Methylosinus sp. Sm6]
MPRSSKRPGLHCRAILALIATLLFVFQGALVASLGHATPAERHAAMTAGQTEATLCLGDLEPADGRTTPHDSHCASDCCVGGRGPSVAQAHETPTLAVAEPFEPAAPPPAPAAPASGWASSWSSRAPPAR